MTITTEQAQLVEQAVNIIRETSYVAYDRKALTSANMAKDFVRLRIGSKEKEVFLVMFLDTQHRVIKDEIMFEGTIDSASVYPREVFRRAFELNATALIVAHNHPSGVSEPSMSDNRITEKLKKGADALDMRILDHLIVGKDIYSYAESSSVL